MSESPKEGWKLFDNAKKYHWIGPDMRSLCGRWGAWSTADCDPVIGEPHAAECGKCRSKLNKRTTLGEPDAR